MITLRNHFKKVPPLSGRGDPLARSVLGYASNQNFPSNIRGVAAFTLLEVILAVAIAGALLAGAATLMVSVTNAWLERGGPALLRRSCRRRHRVPPSQLLHGRHRDRPRR